MPFFGKRLRAGCAAVIAVLMIFGGTPFPSAGSPLKTQPPNFPDPSPKTRIPLPTDNDLSFPQADSSSCGLAHKFAAELLKEFDSLIPASVKQAVKEYVDGRDKASSAGKAWDDYAVALLLNGDAQSAAWSGLNAISIEWTGHFVANTAVYLIHLLRLKEALSLLQCSYATGYRSPYLFEAFSTLFRLQGDRAKSTQYILLASNLAPDDPAIIAEVSMATTGGPPPPSKKKSDPKKDNLDQAREEVESYAQRVKATAKALTKELNRLEHDPDAGSFRNQQLDLLNQEIDLFLDTVRQSMERARLKREEVSRQMGIRTSDKNFEKAYRSYARLMYNQAISACITYYLLLTDRMVMIFSANQLSGSGPGFDLKFWAEVLYMDPDVFAQEQRQVHEINDGRNEILPREKGQFANLGYPFYLQYRHDMLDASREYLKAENVCNEIPPGEASDACHIRNDAKFCSVMSQIYNERMNQSKNRYDLAANRFDVVARNLMVWGHREVMQAQDFALRYFKALKFEKKEPKNISSGQGTMMTESEMYLQNINAVYKILLDHVANPNETSGLVQYLNEKARRFIMDRAQMEQDLASEYEAIEEGGHYLVTSCAEARRKLLELLAQEAWKEYLQSLKDNMKGDFQVVHDPTMNYDLSIGPWSIGADEQGNLQEGFKTKLGGSGIESGVNFKNGDFTGASVGLGGVAGVPGVVVKGDANIFIGKNPQTGKWDGGFVLSGAPGLGLQNKVKAFGHDFGLGGACHPGGSVSATFYARAFYDHAVEYVKADMSGPQ